MKKYVAIMKDVSKRKGILDGMMLVMLLITVHAPTMRCTLFLNEPKEPEGIAKADIARQIIKHNQ